VTIPIEIREPAGRLPHTEVAFEFDGEVVRLVRAKSKDSRGAASLLICEAGATSQ
jgi:bifunctional DNA-binding transcriptional regulator/antitoxin component of YhaV-PrlF toxin-antitoxin module